MAGIVYKQDWPNLSIVGELRQQFRGSRELPKITVGSLGMAIQ